MSARPPAVSPEVLEEMRRHVDEADRALVEAFQRRRRWSSAIQRLKEAYGAEQVDPDREAEVVENYQRLGATGDLAREVLRLCKK